MRTIGEVYVASPLLLLDTNCLLIRAVCIAWGTWFRILITPPKHGHVNVYLSTIWRGPQTNQHRVCPHHSQQRITLQTRNETL